MCVVSLTVVIAPDSFKGSLSGLDVAAALADGWKSVRPGDTVIQIPLADGGEGTLDAIEAAVEGSQRHDVGLVAGPDGRPTTGVWLELPGRIAVVELAQMSGLPLMERLDALGATTVGLGQVIRAALDAGAERIVIGLGGSASTDGAAGALSALGLATRGGGALGHGGAALAELDDLDVSGLVSPPPGGVVLLTDVDAPLLGARGAAAVFGPQKGASRKQVETLEAALAHFASLLGGDTELPGAGAAGGTGYGFSAAWNATISPGADYIIRLTGAAQQVRDADVVLTGEGRFDATSATGKLVGELIRFASAGDARVGVVAGAVTAQPTSPDGRPLWSQALVDLAGSTDSAMAEPARWLRLCGAAAARALGVDAV
jgi:glycerate kinase